MSLLKQVRTVERSQDSASTPESWAETFKASRPMTDQRIRRMRAEAEWKLIRKHIECGKHVLDAGCGFGEWVRVLEASGYRATGVDFSAGLVSRLEEAYPDGSWLCADVRSIPVPDHAFDAVISWGVIEHDEAGPAAALREYKRVTRPGGKLIVSVPWDTPQQRAADGYLLPSEGQTAFFQYAMTIEELASAVAREGLEVVETGTISGAALAMAAPRFCVWCRGKGLAGRLLERIGTLIASQFRRYHLMIYVVARVPDGAEAVIS